MSCIRGEMRVQRKYSPHLRSDFVHNISMSVKWLASGSKPGQAISSDWMEIFKSSKSALMIAWAVLSITWATFLFGDAMQFVRAKSSEVWISSPGAAGDNALVCFCTALSISVLTSVRSWMLTFLLTLCISTE